MGSLSGQLLLMRVAFGVPKLPVPRLDEEKFYSTVRRVFGGLAAASEQRLWALVETSMEQRHGTILVISAQALRQAEIDLAVQDLELGEARAGAVLANAECIY